MQNILVIGSANIDYIATVDSMPKPGETVLGKDFEIRYGGKGANQAYTAALLGSKVSFLTSVGTCELTEKMIKNYEKAGIDTKYINKTDDTTGLAIITLDKFSENSIIVIPGANNKLDVELVEKNTDLIKKSDIIILQNEIPIKTNEYIIDLAFRENIKVALNLAPAKNLSEKYLEKLEFLIVNESELEFLSKELDELLNIGVKNIILTLGSKGSMLINKNLKIEVGAEKVKAVDTTGAGDSFIGAFFNKFNGENHKEALEFATHIAALVVTKKGAQVEI